MKLKGLWAVLGAAACAWVLLGSPAPAGAAQDDPGDQPRPREERPPDRSREDERTDPGEARRRGIVEDRLGDLAARLRLAQRERAIHPYTAARIYGVMDYVRDFLDHDRYVNDAEFDRRMRDLEHAEFLLRVGTGPWYGRYAPYYRRPPDRGPDRDYDRDGRDEQGTGGPHAPRPPLDEGRPRDYDRGREL